MALMFGDLGIDEFASARFERCESAFLVNSHQPAVAGNIGRENSGQPPYDALLSHNDQLNRPWIRIECMVRAGVSLSGNAGAFRSAPDFERQSRALPLRLPAQLRRPGASWPVRATYSV